MRLRLACLLMLALLTGLPGAITAQVASLAATPTLPDLGITLPTEAQMPTGMMVTMDGQRTLDDVLANFPDKEGAQAQFEAWGWRANVVRAFHLPERSDTAPDQLDGVYISVHQFGSDTAAMDALDFIFATHLAGTDLEEIPVEGAGDYARGLYGAMPYGNEVTWYVQQGDLVIRFSAAAPEGDPRPVAEPLLQAMLATGEDD